MTGGEWAIFMAAIVVGSLAATGLLWLIVQSIDAWQLRIIARRLAIRDQD